MTQLERTENAVLIREIITHPRVYPHVTQDTDPAADDFTVILHPSITYVLARFPCGLKSILLGLWTLIEVGSDVQIHTCLLPISFPGARQVRAKAARDMIEWIWLNTKAERLTTNVPAYNKLARRFAEAGGLVYIETKVASYLKGGVMHDEFILGVNRPDGGVSSR